MEEEAQPNSGAQISVTSRGRDLKPPCSPDAGVACGGEGALASSCSGPCGLSSEPVRCRRAPEWPPRQLRASWTAGAIAWPEGAPALPATPGREAGRPPRRPLCKSRPN